MAGLLAYLVLISFPSEVSDSGIVAQNIVFTIVGLQLRGQPRICIAIGLRTEFPFNPVHDEIMK